MTKPTDPVADDAIPGNGELEALVISRDLSTMVAVAFEGTDHPERCEWCPDWRFECVDLDEGHTVLREGTCRPAAWSPSGKKQIPKC